MAKQNPQKSAPGEYVWAIRKFTVTFSANGHGASPSDQTVKYGALAVEPVPLTAMAYDFSGWYTDLGCTTPYDFDTPVTQSLTLYAKWSKSANAHTATFTADGAVVATVDFIEGDAALVEPSVPVKAGYTGAWETYDLANAKADITVNAIYTPIQKPTHTVTFIADGSTVATVTFTDGDAALVEPSVPVKAHYNGAWEAYNLAAATSDITVNAVYTLNNSHSYVATVVAPTCTADGYTEHTCSVCGDSYRDNAAAALGHDYQLNAAKSVAASTGVEGYEYYECSHDASHFYKLPLVALKATHVATFKIGGDVIAQITFTEGDTSLNEPVVPEKANYVGAWETYDLAAATADITINGVYTPVDPGAVSDIETGVTAEYSNSVVTINLSASAATQTVKVTSEKPKPVDVVLVLDQSGSMAATMGGSQSKRDALVSCANDFVRQLYENAVKTGADHRVAVVGFAYGAYNNGRYVNTGLLATPSGRGKNYANLTNADYKAALLSINNGGTINANVTAGINSIVADGATSADLGLKIANNIFSQNPTNGLRERIVIFITDGTPTWWGETASLVRQTAAGAITEANTLKNAQGAKIYSVGVETGANPTAPFTSVSDGVTVDARGTFVSYDFNRFLHAVSSNYPNAAAMSNLGSGDKGAGYYMGVTNTASLGGIFTNILYNTVYELKTFDKATLFYTLTKGFTLTIEQELALREALKAQGLTDADIAITRKADGTTSLRFENVPAKQETLNGVRRYVAAASFQVMADKDVSGTTVTGTSDSGAAYEGAQTMDIAPATVNVPANRNLIVFTISGQTYCIVEAAQGSAITVPVSDLAKWTVADGETVTGSYAVFEATEITDTFGVRWIFGNREIVQNYGVGETVTPPDADAKSAAPANYEFTGWSPAAPDAMPAYSLVCTALYSPKHEHTWTVSYYSGSCTDGITTHYVCACGETKAEKSTTTADHKYTAVLSDNGTAGTTVEKLVCSVCGHAEEKNVTYKVTYSQSRKTTVLDLNLYENEVSVSEPNQKMEMRVYIGDYSGRNYTVTRIDSAGRRTTYTTKLENGYLVFDADHFSIYVINAEDEEEAITYEASIALLDAAEPVVDSTPLAENQNSDGGDNSGNGDGSSNSGSNSNGRPSYYGGSSGGSSSTNTVTKPVEQKPEETPWINPFADVAETAYYYAAVAWASQLGVTNGTGGNSFSPNKSCSRAEIVTFLWRAKGSPEPTLAQSPFDDLDENAYYYKAALWAYENGVTYGASETGFVPNADCTRAQVVTFLWRAENSPAVSASSDFVDVDSASYYAEAVAWAAAQAITNGTGDGAFSPEMACTRAQIVTFLYRVLAEQSVT